MDSDKEFELPKSQIAPDFEALKIKSSDLGSFQLPDHDFTETSEGSIAQRSKTSLRMRYEAEVKVIRNQIGDLESVRNSLNLSRRKICQLLMVDPSAWTRWTKDENKVPPHIYRALQWYLALVEKYPQLHPQNKFIQRLQTTTDPQAAETEEDIRQQMIRLKRGNEELKDMLESSSQKLLEAQESVRQKNLKNEQVQAAWKLLLIMNSIVLFWLLVASLL